MLPGHLACSRCGGVLAAGEPGVATLTQCPNCGAEAQVTVFPALRRAAALGQAPQLILEDGKAACFYHPQKLAVVPCDACGRFLCALCDVELHGGHFCPACLEAGRQKGRLPTLEPGRTRYDQIARSMVLVSLVPPLCLFLPWVTAPLTVGLVLWKWRAPPSLVSNSRRRMAVSAALAVLEFAGVALFWKMAVWSH
jgi:hypothetical protein